MDTAADNLMEEVALLAIRLKLQGDYIENLTIRERRRLMAIVKRIIKAEEEEMRKAKSKR